MIALTCLIIALVLIKAWVLNDSIILSIACLIITNSYLSIAWVLNDSLVLSINMGVNDTH